MHKALGKGLEALIPAANVEAMSRIGQETRVSIERIQPNENQPRKYFDDEKINELARSIKKHGLAQSLLVKPLAGSGNYELIAGERRLRAARKAGLKEVPVMIRDVSDLERLQLALTENLQREDLNLIEQAAAFKSMMDHFGSTQEEISEILSISRSKVANIVRLLNLPAEIKDLIAQGIIPGGQARALVGIEDEEMQKDIAKRIVNEKLTTREVEKFVADWKQAITSKKVKIGKKKNPEVRNLEEMLQRHLGTKIEIKNKKRGGWIRIEYYSNDDLERILDIIQCKKKLKK
ncbi:MAG: ParB/RepB/Spo0J family partition protein [bacterium]